MTVSISDLAPARRGEVLELMREVYGEAMSEGELDWLFDRNPVGPRLLSVAEQDGRVAGVLGMTFARALAGGREHVVAFAVHAATHPASRGEGIFSRLELRNEERARRNGATLALGFPNRLSGPVLVGRLGWRDLYRMRLWARPLRPRRSAGGALPPPSGRVLERFTDAHESAWRAVQPGWGNCLVRDAAYLNWRYVESPKDYRAFASEAAYAVLGHTVHRGISAAVVFDLVGPRSEQRGLLRRCLREARGGPAVAIGVPAPDQRAAYLSLGFLPTWQTIRVIGKPLAPEAELPSRWHFSLGDTDFV